MTSSRTVRPPLPAGVMTLPASYYIDPVWFGREIDTIFSTMWVAAGRVEQLPRVGAYIRRRFANVDVIVVRDERGGVSAVHNVCRHRGTRLCAQEEGVFGARSGEDGAGRAVIQCPYHAWTYALDGRLLGAPHMEQVEGFDTQNYPLQAVATAEWDGHLFLNLSRDPLPLRAQLAGLDAKFRPWRMEGLRCVERRTYDVAANWKLIVQNYSECLHCPIAHPLLHRQTHYLSGENEPPTETYLGGRMDLRDGVGTHSLDGTTTRACLGELPDADRRRVYYYAILPNLLLNLHPDYMLTFTLWPMAPDRTRIVCEWSFDAGEMGRAGFDPRDAIAFWDVTNAEDWALSEAAQAGIDSAGYRPGPYSNREELLVAFDRWVLRKVEGQ
jgi:Rieske 2Fe-2S family protein